MHSASADWPDAAARPPLRHGAPPAEGITTVSYTPHPPGFLSGWERWCEDFCDCIRDTRLRGYKRLQRMHRGLLYPECPPQCTPTYGYFQTTWRQFPTDGLPMTAVPAQIMLPNPAAPLLPEHAAPPQPPAGTTPPAPPAAEPYFPEPAPRIEPAKPAPAPEPSPPPAAPAPPPVQPAPPAEASEVWLPPILGAQFEDDDEPPALVWLDDYTP